jgi:methylase of polypeptide subunit release factors
MIQEHKLPKTFDWIVVNPPWLSSSKMEGESVMLDGVYDDSHMLRHSFTLASTLPYT